MIIGSQILQIAPLEKMLNLHGLDAPGIWDGRKALLHLRATGVADGKRTAQRRLQALNFLPAALAPSMLLDDIGRGANTLLLDWAIGRARKQRHLVLFAQLWPLPNGAFCLHANDARGARYWLRLNGDATGISPEAVGAGIAQLQLHVGKAITLIPHGKLVAYLREVDAPSHVLLYLGAYRPSIGASTAVAKRASESVYLARLESESIHIIREAVAESDNPAMLYSAGKDSSVMLHLARKAFFPGRPPFPLLHVDTRWKFQEMYQFRDQIAQSNQMELIVHINPDAITKDINPFVHGSTMHTDITKTEGLKQALDLYKFDLVFGGARRDEEASRSKERIFSFRSATHQWNPKQQRPEVWNLYNAKKKQGEGIRVFPLSNWTELDIWHYIYQENIPVVPLYFARKRAVVVRDGMLIMVDDHRFPLAPGEKIFEKTVRFRTLGCYPLSGALESSATTLEQIILELVRARTSERKGRAIDNDLSGSMERKKQEGYF